MIVLVLLVLQPLVNAKQEVADVRVPHIVDPLGCKERCDGFDTTCYGWTFDETCYISLDPKMVSYSDSSTSLLQATCPVIDDATCGLQVETTITPECAENGWRRRTSCYLECINDCIMIKDDCHNACQTYVQFTFNTQDALGGGVTPDEIAQEISDAIGIPRAQIADHGVATFPSSLILLQSSVMVTCMFIPGSDFNGTSDKSPQEWLDDLFECLNNPTCTAGKPHLDVADGLHCDEGCTAEVVFSVRVLDINDTDIAEHLVGEMAEIMRITIDGLQVISEEDESGDSLMVLKILAGSSTMAHMSTLDSFILLATAIENGHLDKDDDLSTKAILDMICVGGCDGTPYENEIVLPAARTQLLADIDQSDCFAPLHLGVFCADDLGGLSLMEPRWAFNDVSLQCEKFHYRGCGGNLNNFVSETLCDLECASQDNLLSFFCAAELIEEHFSPFSSRSQYSSVNPDISECRREFHEGNHEDHDSCYSDVDGYQTSCGDGGLDFCAIRFHELLTNRTWTDYTCLPEACDNTNDRDYLLMDTIRTCNMKYGACSAQIACDISGDFDVDVDLKLLEERKLQLLQQNSCTFPAGQKGFRCGNGNCINNDWVCDGTWECDNDEHCGCNCWGYQQCSTCPTSFLECDGYNCYHPVRCFSSDSTVLLESNESITLENLKVGDRVLAVDRSGDTVFDDVYVIVHDGSTDLVPLLRISYGEGAGRLDLSSSHLLYLHPQDDRLEDRSCVFIRGQKACTYMAKDVHIGSVLYALKDGMLTAFPVDDVTTITSTVRGVLTITGNVVVNGVLSSCYIGDHNYKHATLIIPRWCWENLQFLPVVVGQRVIDLFTFVDEMKNLTQMPMEYLQLGTAIGIALFLYLCTSQMVSLISKR